MALTQRQKKLIRLQQIKKDLKELDAEKVELEAEMTGNFHKEKRKSLEFKAGGKRLKATRVQPERLEVDERRFKTKVGAAVYKRCTKTVLSMDLVQKQVAQGAISPADVSSTSEVVKSRAYILFSGEYTKGN